MTVPGWDQCMDHRIRSVVTGPVTGYGTASVTTPYPWITSSIGGKGVVNFGSSRYLDDLLHLVGASHNAIRFNSAGAALHRPSGAAPVALRQSTANPDAAPYRWNLESLGSGQYRIRNANPGRPASGECAYRQSGTSNVLVGPCNSTNEYKWTVVDDIRTVFKLRNVASGTCLDNNNAAGDANLRLASCVNGYSTRQSLFPDAYSRPQ